MLVKVTHEDICNGRKEASDMCPIALAIKRQYPEFCYTRVWGDTIGLAKDASPSIEVITPNKAYEFTQNFDNGIAVAPFSFTLNLEDLKERA